MNRNQDIERMKYVLVVFSACLLCACGKNKNGNQRLHDGVDTAYVSSVWVSDQGDGTYINPILDADYSDPDVCQNGGDYYMTASSFTSVPGLPILHSTDLVNWKLIGHGVQELLPKDHYAVPRHGCGVWAPNIKYHNSVYYIYWGDPDFGIFRVTATDPAGPWTSPELVKAGKGLIDPSILWDDDGKVYMSHAFAGSRSGINSIAVIQEMDATAAYPIGPEVLIVDGNVEGNHTLEGTKLYKRDGFYYVFAPAGGVEYGWQIVARSKHIYGPYAVKTVLAQGETDINGPHQGAWVETLAGQSWFLHFQDKEYLGRVLHLNPVEWIDGWPVMGIDSDGDGCGWPVRQHKKPDVGAVYSIETPVESDGFDSPELGLQWSWNANPRVGWAFPSSNGYLRLYAEYWSPNHVNLWDVPNLLLQKIPTDSFTATTAVKLRSREGEDRVGLVVFGNDYAALSLKFKAGLFWLEHVSCQQAMEGTQELIHASVPLQPDARFEIPSLAFEKEVYLRVVFMAGGLCQFSYSLDNVVFSPIGKVCRVSKGRWVGAKMGLYCIAPPKSISGKEKGWADVDWFVVE